MSQATSVQLFLWLWLYLAMGTSSTDILHTDAGVVVNQEGQGQHFRVKRASGVNRNINGFNSNHTFWLLRRHNDLRSITEASDMIIMEWDSALEASAQEYAEKCEFQHSSDRSPLGGYNYVGENLYAGTAAFNPVDVVQSWYDEVVDYNYNTRSCTPGTMCGHYTQIVWASSRALGCGVKYCPYLKFADQFGFSAGYNVVCHYGPGGNYVGRFPYSKGASCSQCPPEYKYCVKNLCSLRPQIGSGSSQTADSLSLFVMLFSTLSAVVLNLLSA